MISLERPAGKHVRPESRITPGKSGVASRKEHAVCRCLFAVVGVALLAASAGPARAGDAARALLDRALQATGGEAVLAKYPASTAKIKGSVRRGGLLVAMGGETTTQGADQVRFATV